jgi:cobalt/nickel transport system permease protein
VLNGFSKGIIVPIINILVFTILHIAAKNPFKYIFKLLVGLMTFSLISSITFVYDYGVNYAMLLLIRTLSSSLCLLFLSFTTPLDDILYYLSKASFFKDVSDIIKSTERFLILIEDECSILLNAIKSRGGFETKSSVIKNTGKLAGLLFVNVLIKWKYVKEALNSRCYNGQTVYMKGEFSFESRRFILILLYVSILIVMVNLN